MLEHHSKFDKALNELNILADNLADEKESKKNLTHFKAFTSYEIDEKESK